MSRLMNTTTTKWWVLFTMCLLTVMLNFDVTAVNLAIPEISKEFHATLANMQWVINAFVLVSAVFQIIAGRAGDLWGHRRLFIVGVIIFIVSSLVAGAAHTTLLLIMARAGQGLALGIAYPMTIALIYAAFPPAQRVLAVGYVMGTMGISLASGPLLGGLIVYYVGWRWIFLVNVPIGLLTIFLAYLFCKRDISAIERQKMDYVGGVLLTLGLTSVVLALNEVQQWGWSSPIFITTFLVGLLVLVILFLVERKCRDPLIDFNLFRLRSYVIYNLIRVIAQVIFIPILFFIPIYLQNIAQYDAVTAGLIMLFLTLVIGVLAPLAGKWVGEQNVRLPTVVALLAFMVGCLLLTQLTPTPRFILLASALIFIGIGTSLSFVSTLAGAMQSITLEKTGLAMGIFLTIVFASCAVGVALFGTILVSSSHAWLLTATSQAGLHFNAAEWHEINRIARGVESVQKIKNYLQPGVDLAAVTNLAKAAFIHGFRTAMGIFSFIAVAGLALTIFVANDKKEKIS